MESARTKGGNIASEAGSRIWRRSKLGVGKKTDLGDKKRKRKGSERRAAKVGGEKGV